MRWMKKKGIIMLESCFVLGMLGIGSIEDLKSRRLSVWMMCSFGIVGVILHLLLERGDIISILGGVLIGAALVGISLLSRGRVGLGDGLALMVTGIFLGFEKNLMLFMVSQCLVACFALFLMVFCKKDRHCEIPYIPFLLVSYVSLLAFGGMT